MCGIFGIAEFGNHVGSPSGEGSLSSLLGAMGRALEHRGPDDDGTRVLRSSGAAVGIGMRRLSIIDVAGGRQPMTNEDGTVIVVCNGEIYNYRELREELASKGHCLRTQSDTEVIVHLYEEHGWACVTRLRGMFAFALWDARQQVLMLARDRLGIKPLFFHYDHHRAAFASKSAGCCRPSRKFRKSVVRHCCGCCSCSTCRLLIRPLLAFGSSCRGPCCW